MLVVKNKRSPHYSCYDAKGSNQYAFHPLFVNELNRFLGSDEQAEIPKVNIIEDDASYTLELAVPGIAKEELKIHIEKDHLSISTEMKKNVSTHAQGEVKHPKFLKKEFSYNGFKRSFKMPENTESDGIKATYENGILKVILPKKDITRKEGSKIISIS